ncbi:rhodanese-like domain-containing protein [Pseudoalteromonas sp. G4]|uniref:rhodanese-like domain-containing protein n=1 Tax=Pseudoalteromonas sp. G4 TaxID=2992761 RepID=UPI00237D4EB2|nr:rhodanese-like domain-containing protein [Pseudoalteromonas sp. G4]MDE3273358.1 rhodanese-like domain-containing protein [Pseudoalteromonas sp. G4]
MLKTIPDLIKLASENVKKVDSAQAKAEIAQNNGLLIDVREPAEHAIKNAVGAINIPRGVLEMKLVEIEKDADRPIYLHCATGGRATLAAEQLQRVGYNNVTVISCKADSVCETFC